MTRSEHVHSPADDGHAVIARAHAPRSSSDRFVLPVNEFRSPRAADRAGETGSPPAWSQRRDSNPQPADYKSAALPIEPRWREALSAPGTKGRTG